MITIVSPVFNTTVSKIFNYSVCKIVILLELSRIWCDYDLVMKSGVFCSVVCYMLCSTLFGVFCRVLFSVLCCSSCSILLVYSVLYCINTSY